MWSVRHPRPVLGPALALLLAAAALPAQHDGHPPTDEHAGEHAVERGLRSAEHTDTLIAPAQHLQEHASASRADGAVLAPLVGLLPLEALHELEAGAQAVRRFENLRDRTHTLPDLSQGPDLVRQAYDEIATPRARPPRCPRWLAAVVVDPESGVDPAYLFQRARRDLLVLQNPGPCLRSEELALLERLIEREALPLVVVLVQRRANALLRRQDPSPAQTELERRTAAARELARRTGVDLARAHAEIEARRIFEASPQLTRLRAAGRFQVVLGVLDEHGRLDGLAAPWRTNPIEAMRAQQALRDLLEAQRESIRSIHEALDARARSLDAPPEHDQHGHGPSHDGASGHGESGHGAASNGHDNDHD